MNSDEAEWAAHDAWEAGDLRTALRIYQALAKQGCNSAQVNLGYFYDNGVGIRPNRTKAMYWYRRAYLGGSCAAASNIATIYRDEKRPALEVAWYRKAVALGDTDALLEIGKHYLVGLGVRRNIAHAVSYLKRAAATPLPLITEAGREEARRLLRSARRTGGGSNYAFDSGAGTQCRVVRLVRGAGQRNRYAPLAAFVTS